MSTLRDETRSPGPGADWKQPSSPHGYDQPEFDPAQAPRDYKRTRVHGPDEERRHLRRVQEELDEAVVAAPASKDEPWDTEETGADTATPSPRLYRD